MDNKQEFIELFKKHIKREGADKLLNYLEKTDFFTAPASTEFHGSYEGGLVEHSINAFHCLKDYLQREAVALCYGLKFTEETMAVVALLHDICMVDCYEIAYRNQQDENTGDWSKVPYYKFNEKIPFGHGEKSFFIISQFIKLNRNEAMAIRFHMGFSRKEDNPSDVGSAFEKYPLSFALSTADMEATYFVDGKKPNTK